MAQNAGCSRISLISSEPLNGMLHIQRKKNPMSSWEFYVGRANELNKLPSYPITHEDYPEGILVTLKYGENQCQTAFHGYNGYNKQGSRVRYIYIGSAKRLLGPKSTELYQNFLNGSFGVIIGKSTAPIPVKLDFQSGNVVYVS